MLNEMNVFETTGDDKWNEEFGYWLIILLLKY